MNKLTMIVAPIALGAACLAFTAVAQDEYAHRGEAAREREKDVQNRDAGIDMLYELVRQARADLRALREPTTGHKREGRGEHAGREREGRGEHAGLEHEGRGEHGESGGEEGGNRLGKNKRWDETRNGARLVIAYDERSQSFRGIVVNTTARTLSDVRVEVHLSNGVELGPTKRTDLKPGQRMPVELSAAGQEFTWWTTHPEHGSEEGHGPGHEGRGDEHGKSGGDRPGDPALRPLYNQLQLLRQEIRMLGEDLRRSGGKE
jgi:hypothetical protein